MATKVAEMFVELGARIDDFEKNMSKAEAKFTSMGKKFQTAGKKLTLGVTLPLAAIGGAAIKMAMDAVESENLFEVSMGNMAKAARAWSEELSASLGLNQYEVRKTVGTFNVMMKSMGLSEKAAYDMAKGLTQLGYDMASFYNLKPEEAFLKLQSAISGEVEPLKRLGIIVNETTIKTWAMNKGLLKQGEQLSESQKVLARFNVIMEQTKQAQGDLARTIDSPTNKMRILKSRVTELGIEIGMKLLPIFEKVLKEVEKIVTWFSKLDDGTKNNIIRIAGLAAVAGPLASVFGKLLIIVPKLGIAIKALLGPIGAVTAAAAIAYKEINELIKAKEREVEVDWQAFSAEHKLGQKLREVADAAGLTRKEFIELTRKYDDNVRALALAIRRGEEGKKLQEAMINIGKKRVKQQEEIKKATEKEENALVDLNKEFMEAVDKMTKVTEKAKTWKDELHELGEKTIPEKEKRIKELEKLLKELHDQYKKGTLDLDAYGRSTKKVEKEIKELSTTLSYTAVPAARDFADIWKQAPEVLEDKAVPAFKKAQKGIKEFATEAQAAVSKVLNAVETISGAFADISSSIAEGDITGVISSIGDALMMTGEPITMTIGGVMKLGASLWDLGKSLLNIKSDSEKVQESLQALGDVSEETAESIAEDSETMSKAAAEGKNLSKIIDDVGISVENVGGIWLKMNNTLRAFVQGELDAATASRELSYAFDKMLAASRDLGEEGSRQMVNFIKKVRESGLKVQSVMEYTQEQLKRVPSALTKLVGALDKTGGSVEDMGKLAVHTFNAMLADGMSFTDAVSNMKEPLEALKAKYAELGMSADPALKKLFRIVDITEKNKELFEAVDANREVLEALGNSGWLTADAFETITKNATSYYGQLKKSGLSSEDALRAMVPTLQKIYDYAQAYGFEVDANTQKLIDQAKEKGLLKESEESMTKKMLELMGNMNDALEKLGLTMEELVDLMSGAMKKAVGGIADGFGDWQNMLGGAGGMIDGLKDKIAAGGFEIPFDLGGLGGEMGGIIGGGGVGNLITPGQGQGVGAGGPGGELPGFQHGGLATYPQIAHVGETPELITPLKELRRIQAGMDAGSEQSINISPTFNITAIDGNSVREVVRKKLAPELINMIEANLLKTRMRRALEIT